MPSPSSAASPSPARSADQVHVITGWRKLLASCAGLIVRAWCASLRLEVSATTRRVMEGDARPTLFVLWHNRLFVGAELSRRLRPARPLHGLVSASKDGAWLSAFFESAGLRAVRGSSSRGGREAASALVEVLRGGHDAGITPDGPRGPIYVCKPGAITVARRANARVVLVGIRYAQAWRLRSWDRFLLPRPFSTVFIHAVTTTEEGLSVENARDRVEKRLREINACDSTDRLSPFATATVV